MKIKKGFDGEWIADAFDGMFSEGLGVPSRKETLRNMSYKNVLVTHNGDFVTLIKRVPKDFSDENLIRAFIKREGPMGFYTEYDDFEVDYLTDEEVQEREQRQREERKFLLRVGNFLKRELSPDEKERVLGVLNSLKGLGIPPEKVHFN